MTRWARGGPANKKKPLEATGWADLKSKPQAAPENKLHIKQSKIKGLKDSSEKKKKKSKKLKHQGQNESDSKPSSSLNVVEQLEQESDDSSANDFTSWDKTTEKREWDVKNSQLLEYVRKDQRREDRRLKRVEQRQNSRVCFNCREPGHDMSACPQVTRDVEAGTGICFKCGSTEHTVAQCRANIPAGKFPFAKCFICNEVGHLSRNCPDNPRGLYPNGGCCRICESVEHFKKDCPELQKQQGIQDVSLSVIKQGTSLDADEMFVTSKPAFKNTKTKHKVVKF